MTRGKDQVRVTEQVQETVHHVPMRKRRRLPRSRMQLNLTAMIDVIFLLLVYFVVTANFMVEEGVLTSELPKAQGATEETLTPPAEPLRVKLTERGATAVGIEVAGQPVSSFTELFQALKLLQYEPEQGLNDGVFPADHPVLIESRGQVRWQHVVNAFNAAVRARYENVALAQPGDSADTMTEVSIEMPD